MNGRATRKRGGGRAQFSGRESTTAVLEEEQALKIVPNCSRPEHVTSFQLGRERGLGFLLSIKKEGKREDQVLLV